MGVLASLMQDFTASLTSAAKGRTSRKGISYTGFMPLSSILTVLKNIF